MKAPVVAGIVLSGLAAVAVVAVVRGKRLGGSMGGASLGKGGSGPGWSAGSDVLLTEPIADFLTELAARAQVSSIFVTSGVRTAEDQARALLKKMELGESWSSLYALYKRDDLIQELDGIPLTLEAWTDAIAAQIDRGDLLSSHLSGRAVDLRVDVDRNGSISSAEKDRMDAICTAAKALGARVVIEDTPAHIHLELGGALRA